MIIVLNNDDDDNNAAALPEISKLLGDVMASLPLQDDINDGRGEGDSVEEGT
jgi:hypothetical protein